MSFTQQQWTQAMPFTDGQIFYGVSAFQDTAGIVTTRSLPSAGLLAYTLSASHAYAFATELNEMLRTGFQINYQEQFGTTGPPPVAGPTSVTHTSDPLALPQQIPPILKASLPTIAGARTGYQVKGVQINWVDVIYLVSGAALTAATIGLTSTQFQNNTAAVVTNIITLGSNGLPTAIQTNPYVTRVTPATPLFVTTLDSELILNINLTTTTSGTGYFYGCNVGVSFNFN